MATKIAGASPLQDSLPSAASSSAYANDREAVKWVTGLADLKNLVGELRVVNPQTLLVWMADNKRVSPATGGLGGTLTAPQGIALVDCRYTPRSSKSLI